MQKKINTEIIINSSKEVVWNILADFNNYKNWNPFIIDASGKLEEGETLKVRMKNGTSESVFKPKVISVTKYKSFDWKGKLLSKAIFTGHHFFVIEELDKGQVKLIQHEIFGGMLSGLILKKSGDEFRNNFIKMNQAIKDLAENSL